MSPHFDEIPVTNPRLPVLPEEFEPIIVPGNEVDNLQLLQSNLGNPIPLAYGRHLVRGNIILQHKQSQTNTRIFIALGDGEWDGVEVLFINGKVTPLSSTAHFHPGIDGETGTETTPNNGNQKICSLWPATFADKFTFSNTAYLALSLGLDVEAVGPGFDVVSIYRTRKVRIFDSAGAITSFVYTTNPAWICLDVIIEHEVRKRALVGSALTAAQKARIDFQSFIDWAADCDVDIGGGKKRFEANVAITRQTDLKRSVELLLIIGRAYLITTNGKLTAAMDKSRSSVATITRDEILEGGLSFGRKSTRNLANRVKIQYRNLVSGDGVGTFSTVGTTLIGVGAKFLEMYKPGEPIQARSGAQEGEVQVVDTVTSDTAGTLKAAFSSDQTTQSHGNPALDFQISIREAWDETNITETDKEIPIDFDLGNVDAGQAERTANYLLSRTQLLRRAAFIVPPGQVSAGDGSLEWTPGEVITGPKDVEADTTETELWEILEAEDLPGGERQVGVQIFDSTIFSDTESDQQAQTQTVENDGTPQPITDHAQYQPKTNPLTATDVGSDTTIAIANYTMQIGSDDVDYDSIASLTGKPFDTVQYIYVDDLAREGGTIAHFASTTRLDIHNDPARMFVGTIRTPKDGGGQTSGVGDGGSGGASLFASLFTMRPQENTAGTGNAYLNPNDAQDGLTATFADYTDSDSINTPGEHEWQGFQTVSLGVGRHEITLKVDWETIVTGGGIVISRIRYSTDGGATFTAWLSKSITTARNTDSISLGAIDPALVVVEGRTDWVTVASTTVQQKVYDIWLEQVNVGA